MSGIDMMLEIGKLSREERILLAQDIWDTVVGDAEQIPLTQVQAEELQWRLDNLGSNPEPRFTREEVRQRMLNSK